RLRLAIGSDRGQSQRANIVIDLPGDAVILDVVGRAIIGVDHIGERIAGIGDLAADPDHSCGGSGALHVDHTAAILVDLVIVADDPDLEIAAHGLDQELAASEPAIPLIRVFPGAKVLEETIALVDTGREAGRHAFTQRPRNVALGDHL